jgi:hypothetical protein
LLRWWRSDDCWSVWLPSRFEDVARDELDRFFAPISAGQMTTTASWLTSAPQPPQPVAELLQVASLRVVALAGMVLQEVSGTGKLSSSKGAIPLLSRTQTHKENSNKRAKG